MVGLELCVPLLLSLVHDGSLSLARFVHALTEGPSRVIGLPFSGIREGAAADLTLIDPDAPSVIDPSRFRSKSQNTPFKGRKVKGRVLATLVDGRFAFQDESLSEDRHHA
jgi:dihydroorotase